MTWRLAESLKVLRDQVNSLAPTRSKVSDGTIGNQRHSRTASDHNPNSAGVVTALDLTHDPPRFDAYDFAEKLKANHDPRIKYVISNRRIWNPSVLDAWRTYYGVNGHTKHTHISARANNYDLEDRWDLGVPVTTQPVPIPQKAGIPLTRPTLRKGMTGGDVPVAQIRLKALGYYKALTDGSFGPKTEAAVRAFQVATGLKADGIVGTKTWAKLAVQPPVGSQKEMALDVHGLTTSPQAVAVIKSFEQCRLTAYALGEPPIWHIGWGRSNTAGKEPIINRGLTISLAEADAMFLDDLEDFERYLKFYVKIPAMTQGNFDGLMSVIFNKGPTWFGKSELLKAVNNNAWAKVADIILADVPPVGHKFHGGLLRRRRAEVALLQS